MTALGACEKKDQAIPETGGQAARADTATPAPAASRRDSSPPLTAAPASSAPRVLFVGTSLTAGLGLDPEESYPALLQRKADSAGYAVRMVNAGLSGETSAGALRRIDWLLRDPASVVVIETGANDALRGLNVDSTRANIRAIIGKVKSALPGASILLVQMEAPPNMGERYTTRFRAMFPELARSESVTLMPFLLDKVAGIAELNQGDGIHPNVAGERIVAENVWKSLVPMLGKAP
jgi:acyl-CoA thioesterase I